MKGTGKKCYVKKHRYVLSMPLSKLFVYFVIRYITSIELEIMIKKLLFKEVNCWT